MNAIDTRAIIESLDEITIYDDKMNPTVIPSEASSVSFGMMKPGADAAVEAASRQEPSDASVTYNAKIVMHPSVTSDPHHPIPTPDSGAITAKLRRASRQSNHGRRRRRLRIQPDRGRRSRRRRSAYTRAKSCCESKGLLPCICRSSFTSAMSPTTTISRFRT